MTYVKQTWSNGEGGGTPISAARLNYIEAGIEAADDAASASAAALAAHLADPDPHPGTGGGGGDPGVPLTRVIGTGTSSVTGLTGGGDLSADRNLAVDPAYVRSLTAAQILAGANVTVTPGGGGSTLTIAAATDPEVVRDTIGTTLLAGSGIGIVVDDAGNTITINNTSGSAAYNVDVYPVDSTGTAAMDTQIATAIATVNSLYNSSRGAHTVSLRFAPGNFRITNPTVFDALTLTTGTKRGVTICGPTEVGKRATMLIFDSTVGASSDQTVGCLFRLVNQRQFTFRDIGFRSNNPNQTLFYLYCSTGDDGIYPELPANTSQNSGRWRRIYVEGDWKVVWGIDGNTRANLNSEMAFEDWTFSNSLTASDCVFKFGYPLRDAIFLSTGISAPTAGTFTLTYNGETTGSLAYNASAASIQTALAGLSTIGSGNVQVTASSTPTAGSYIIKFIGAMAGSVDTTLFSTTTSGWSGVSWKAFRFPPQQGQFLNYAFRNNEWEYARGDLFQINRGGCITFDGYHSVIIGVGGGTNGGTMFVMPEVPTHPDDCNKLFIGGIFRAELRTQYAKFMDCSWYGVNKTIDMTNVSISITAISGGGTGSTVKGMEVIAFRNKINSQQAFIRLTRCDLPGYITIENATTGASGGVIKLEQCRFKSWTTYSAALFANQTALAADTATAIRVLGSAKFSHDNNTTNGGVAITDGIVSL